MKILERRYGDKVLMISVDSDSPKAVAYANKYLDEYPERQLYIQKRAEKIGRIERLRLELKTTENDMLRIAKQLSSYTFQPFVDEYSAFITAIDMNNSVITQLINGRELRLIHELRRLIPYELYKKKEHIEKKLQEECNRSIS